MQGKVRLAELPLFSGLSAQELDRVRDGAEEQAVEPGDYIYRQGETGDFFYIVLAGEVELTVRREDNKIAMVSRVGPGGHFGEVSLFTDQPRSVNIRAVSAVHLVRFTREFFHSVLLAIPAFHLEMDRILSTRLRLAYRDQVDIIHDRRQSLRTRPETAENHPLLAGILDDAGADQVATGDVSRTVRDVRARIKWFADNLEPLLIVGESGTGRRLCAKQIHIGSMYGNGPYMEADLRQFESGIWEGKLFGHDRDAFPFSQVRQAGIFEQFRGGTVVLHHAEMLSAALQEQLVAAMADGFFRRVAGRTPMKFVTRLIFICGTGSSPDGQPGDRTCNFIPALRDLLRDKVLEIPPLRDHKRDIHRLVRHYLEHYDREYNRNIRTISSGALGLLMNYDWPGNMTELDNVIQRAVLLAEQDEILSEQILLGLPQPEGKQEYNLLRWPVVRRMLESRLFPLLPRLIILCGFTGGLLALLFGPRDPDRNIGLVLSWAIGWPLLLFSFFFLGRIWCSVCSFSMPGNLAQLLLRPGRSVPDFLKEYSGWIMSFLCILVFWVEIVFNAYQSPLLTAAIVLAITLGSFLFSIFFKRRAWCRYICPLGGLNAIFAMPSVMELRANSHFCLNTCQEHKCYRGGDDLEGCPMFRHPFLVDNNRDCTLCANCIKNCPHNSIQVNLRIAPQELWHIRSPRVSDSFLTVAMAAIYFSLARHEQFLALAADSARPHYDATLMFTGQIALLLGIYSLVVHLQARIVGSRFKPVFAATGYGLIPLVLGAFLAVYFEMFVAGAWRFVPLVLSPFSTIDLPGDYRLLSNDATATLQHLIILGGMLAALYATFRIVKRATGADGFSLRLFGLPYGFLLILGALFFLAV